jgi:hypothetical protein
MLACLIGIDESDGSEAVVVSWDCRLRAAQAADRLRRRAPLRS